MVTAIPLAAIVLGIATSMLKMSLKSQETRLELRLRLQQEKDAAQNQQIEALRAEVASLRDTSTQFDMSLQQTLDGINARVQSLEQARRGYTSPSTQEEQVQRVGR
jgi:hypothetical protein